MSITVPPKVRPHVCWMIRRDMPDVMAIEQASHAFPWSEERIVKTLRGRNAIGMVAVIGECAQGFMIYELNRTCITLLDLAVEPAWRQRGIGTALINKLKDKLARGRRSQLVVSVRESNLGAQLFLKACGLKAAIVIRADYEDTGEDSYVFWYQIPNG